MTLQTKYFLYTLICTLFTFLCTIIGSSFVLFFKKHKPNFMFLMMSFASGVMIAASFFSLLIPAIDYSENLGLHTGITVSVGFVLGFLFMIFISTILDKKNMSSQNSIENAYVMQKKKSLKMLFLSITLHNIPEGMCIGVAFALFAQGITTGIAGTVALSIGIGFQNIPEGASISLPLKASGLSKGKSFLGGVLSGIVEPIFALIAYLFAAYVHSLMPILLSFAAACMIYVSLFELLPEPTQLNKKITIIGLILGFVIMMLLDLSLWFLLNYIFSGISIASTFNARLIDLYTSLHKDK